MSSSLFRAEALAHQQQPQMGEVLRVHSLPYSWLTGLALALAISLLVFAVCGHYTRKAHASGFLAPSQGLIKVYAPQTATLEEKKVQEGQQVKRGDVLFVLSAERASRESSDTQGAAIATILERRDSLRNALGQQQSIDHIQLLELQRRHASIVAQIKQLDQQLALQQQRVNSATETRQRYRELLTKHYVAAVQVQEKEDAVLQEDASLQNLKRDRLSLQTELDSVQAEVASSGFKFAQQRAQLERDIANLQQQLTQLQAQRSIVITAPEDGTVTAILLDPGQTANPQVPLLSILPAGSELQAQLLVPSQAIGFISAGQTVDLRYAAFPYQRFGTQQGVVKEVSRTLVSANETDYPLQLQEPAYRVTVALSAQQMRAYNQAMPLQAGMLLDADIRLDRQRLIAWVFDPIYSLTGKL